MTFRRATPHDLEDVLGIIARTDAEAGDWAPDAADAERKRVIELLAADDHYNEVAEAGGRVIGYVNLHAREGAAHLSYLFVDPDHQRRGIGAQLMQRALDDARARGFRRASLGVAVRNPARAFYERTGWIDTAERSGHGYLGIEIAHYALDLTAP